MQLPSQFDRYAKAPTGAKAVSETALSLIGEAVFDAWNYGDTALFNPGTWLKGFGNESSAKEFSDRQERSKQDMVGDFFDVSPETAEIQQQVFEPIVDKVSELYNTGKYQNEGEYFSEFEAVEQYASDPRVAHTLGTAEIAAPAFARGVRSFMDADFKGNLAKTSSPSGSRNKQKGAVSFFGQELYHASKQDIKDEFKPGYSDGLIFLTPEPEFANEWLGKGKFQKRLKNSPEDAIHRDPKDFSDEYQTEYDTQRKAKEDIHRETGVYDAMKRWQEARKDQGINFDEDNPDKADFFRLSEEADDRFRKEYPVSPDKIHNAVYPVTANVRKAFHPEEDFTDLDDFFAAGKGDREVFENPEYKGNYLLYENPEMVDYLKGKGYDGMFLKESSWSKDAPYTTVAAFDPKGVKSVFDPESPLAPKKTQIGGKQKGAASFFDGSSDRGTLHDLQVALSLNQFDSQGMPTTNTLPGKYDNIVDALNVRALNYDPRVDRNSAQRVGTKDKMQSLQAGFDRPYQNVDPLSIFDQGGKGVIFTMSDRLSAQGNVTSVRGVPLNFPINVQGGQGNMFVPDNVTKGQAWASHDIPVGHIQNLATDLKKQTGQDPLLMPWRMSPAAVDFNPRVGQLMMSYAQANMSPDTKSALDNAIREFRSVGKWDKDQQKQVGNGLFIKDFAGIDSPEAYKQFEQAPDSLRKELKLMMDKEFRDKGGLGIGEARLTLTDPTQMNAPDAGLQNVARIDTDRPMIEGSGQPAYAKGLGGEGLGELIEEVNPYDFGVGKNTFNTDIDAVINELVRSRNVDPRNPTANDNRALMMKPYGGIITDEVLRGMEK